MNIGSVFFWGGSFGASPFPISATSLKHPRKSLSLKQKTSRCSLVLGSQICRFNQILPNKTKKTWTNEFLLSSDFWGTMDLGSKSVLGIPIKDCKAATPSFHPPGHIVPWQGWVSDSSLHPPKVLAKFFQLPG